jgi:hypothetical protein
MNQHFQSVILTATQAKGIFEIETIQNLWSGYGKIVRYGLKDSAIKSVVVKHIHPPSKKNHPRGWNTDLSHQRKLKSYQVETAWYKNWNKYCSDACKTPACLAIESNNDEIIIVLQDLNQTGFPKLKSGASLANMKTCLSWLANFHATFLGKQALDLWPIGTYWHLETRPEELQCLKDDDLKNAAKLIDQKLQASPFQTIVHGDAKLANFCFSSDEKNVAAVDFQYVGGGCGMKDVAYFIGSCLDERECEKLESSLLDFYFETLTKAITKQHKAIDTKALEKDWRALFPVAWTDFHRFIKGWSPGHWKIHGYSERLAREVIDQLNNTVK